MEKAAFSDLLDIWQPSKPPRVWSLVVTLFGDLAQMPGATLSGTTLNAILDGIGVKPEATRVALHRLRKDGWITSTKDGRKSNHALTAWGLAQCAAANPTIYGPRPQQAEAWLIATAPGFSKTDGMWAIGVNLWISPQPLADETAFAVPLRSDQQVPSWVMDKMWTPDIIAAADVLHDQLVAFQDRSMHLDQLTPRQIVILRALIVHTWRRLILRAPAVPDVLFPTSWKGADCMARVTEVLDRLPVPALQDLRT